MSVIPRLHLIRQADEQSRDQTSDKNYHTRTVTHTEGISDPSVEEMSSHMPIFHVCSVFSEFKTEIQ